MTMTERRKREVHWLWYLPLTLLIVFLTGWGWLLWCNRTPNIVLPPLPPVPKPNAADFYVQAHGDLNMQAVKTSIGQSLWHTVDPKEPLKYTPAQREAYLDELAPYARPIREAQRYPCLIVQYRPDGSMDFARASKLRDVARYLQFESQTHAAAGQWAAGMSSALDGIHLGADCTRDSGLLGTLIGIAIAAITRDDAWQCVEHLTAPQAKAAATRLRAVMAREATMADILAEEKICTQRYFLMVMSDPHWQSKLLEGDAMDIRVKGALLFKSKTSILRAYTRQMDLVIAETKKPYIERKPLPESKDPFVAMITPVFHKAQEKQAWHQAYNRLLLTALTLRAYRLEHKDYPPNLQALLTAGYLPALPDDPFAHSGTFRYRLDGGKYLLYSIGPDGKDDGGRLVYDPRKPNATGDIVAGGSR